MYRRQFLSAAAGAALTSFVRADDLPKDVRVTRVVGFDLVSQRSKVAGKNARLSSPAARRSQTKNPPPGAFHLHPSGRESERAATKASRRARTCRENGVSTGSTARSTTTT